MKRAILIAFHYPPAKGSSGIQRTLSFSKYLPDYGWNSIVISANRRAYPQSSDDQLSDIPESAIVKRALALDTARHLAFRGRYPGALAYPDRWISWWFDGVVTALRTIRQYKPSVIWSTYPIATAHLIASTVHQITSIPWIADFRDSMTEDDYPSDPRKRRIYKWIEQKTVGSAEFSVFTAPSAAQMYASRYPHIPVDKWKVVLNGYDEDAFQNACSIPGEGAVNNEKTVLLHSGLLYPSERDPTAFFEALRRLKQSNVVSADTLEIRLRASGYDEVIARTIEVAEVGDIVKLLPPIAYADALAEIMAVDGLLLLQASNCNHQIPAKIYEYIRSRKPILAMTDRAGDTATLLMSNGMTAITPLDSADSICACLRAFIEGIVNGLASVASDDVVAKFSRRNQTRELAEIFDSALG